MGCGKPKAQSVRNVLKKQSSFTTTQEEKNEISCENNNSFNFQEDNLNTVNISVLSCRNDEEQLDKLLEQYAYGASPSTSPSPH